MPQELQPLVLDERSHQVIAELEQAISERNAEDR